MRGRSERSGEGLTRSSHLGVAGSVSAGADEDAVFDRPLIWVDLDLARTALIPLLAASAGPSARDAHEFRHRRSFLPSSCFPVPLSHTLALRGQRNLESPAH